MRHTLDRWYDAVLVEISEEKGVDQRGLAQSHFSGHHQGELEPFFDRLPVDLIRKARESNVLPLLLIHIFFVTGR